MSIVTAKIKNCPSLSDLIDRYVRDCHATVATNAGKNHSIAKGIGLRFVIICIKLINPIA